MPVYNEQAFLARIVERVIHAPVPDNLKKELVIVNDMETCYKSFRSDLLKTIPLRSNRFGIEPEITAKIARRRAVIYEVPISYHGRDYQQGKKIGWRDGVSAIWTILKYYFVHDCDNRKSVLPSCEQAADQVE